MVSGGDGNGDSNGNSGGVEVEEERKEDGGEYGDDTHMFRGAAQAVSSADADGEAAQELERSYGNYAAENDS